MPDFEAHLLGGIEELKTPSSNVLTLINEISELSEMSVLPETNYLNENSDDFLTGGLILVNIPQESEFIKQIF